MAACNTLAPDSLPDDVLKCSSDDVIRQMAYERSVAGSARALLCRTPGGDALGQSLAFLAGVRPEYGGFLALTAADGQRGHVRIEASAGFPQGHACPAEGLCFDVSRGLRTAAEEGRLFHGRVCESGIPESEMPGGLGNAPVLCAPVHVSGEWLGLLVLVSTSLDTAWGPEDEQLVRTTADLMAAHLERHRTADEYEQKNKLAGALEMASVVCHKLNQPMQVILGYASMVTSGDIRDEKQIIDIVKLVEDETRKMGIITKNLMGITRMHDAASDQMIR